MLMIRGNDEVIYCVEDDDSIRELIVYTLQASGFQASGFAQGKALYAALEKETPQLILLDIMLPDEDGLTILKNLKKSAQTKNIPIIMATAKGTEYDKVIGLDNGADDYLVKPFGMMEMVSRIKAVLRRTKKEEQQELSCGNIRLNVEQRQVIASQQQVILTHKEFELLAYLMENQGIVLTRDKLLDKIWGYDIDIESRTLDVHIRSLRQKLGQAGEQIETVRGVGYRIGGSS